MRRTIPLARMPSSFSIEVLDVFRCEPGQLFDAQAGPDVVLDVAAVISQHVGPQRIRHILQLLIEPLRGHHPALSGRRPIRCWLF